MRYQIGTEDGARALTRVEFQREIEARFWIYGNVFVQLSNAIDGPAMRVLSNESVRVAA